MNKYVNLHENINLPLGIFFTVIAWVFFALLSACVKVLLESLTPHAILFFENFVAFILFLPLISIEPKLLKAHKKSLILLRSVVGVSAYYLLFFSIKLIPLVDAALLNITAPLFIPFILFFWIKKKISKKQFLGIIIGFIGVIFILKPGTEIFSIGSIFGLISGIFAALAMCSMRLLASESPVTVSIYYLFISSAIMFPFLFFEWQTPSPNDWLFLLISGVLMYFTQVFLTKSYQYACATDLGPFSYSYVIVAGLLGWLIWSDVPTLFSFIGIFLVILGGIITILVSRPTPTNIRE